MSSDQPPFEQPQADELERLHLALQAAGIGTWDYNLLTEQRQWSAICKELFGLPPDASVAATTLLDQVHPDDRQRVAQANAQMRSPLSNGEHHIRFRTLNPANILRWVEVKGKATRDAYGQIIRFSGVAQDVTQQLTAQQALLESEAHLQLLRDTVPAMIFYLDAQQRYQSYNGVFREWFGVAGNEVIGKTVREFLGEDAYKVAMPHLAIAYGGQQERYEIHAPTRMNGDRWLSIVYTPHKNDQGKVIGLIVHSIDITHSKLIESELRDSEARFRSLIEEAPVSTCLFVGPEMRIAVVNEVMLSYWGRDESVIGKPLAEALPELKGQPHLQILEEVFTTGKTQQARQVQADLMVEGELRTYYFDLIHKPLRNAEGEVYGIMDMSMDVTEQVLARQRVEASEAQIRSLVESALFPIGVYVGPEMIIQLANQSIMDVWGKGNKVVGQSYKALLPELANQLIFTQLDTVYATGVAFHAQNQRVDLLVDGRLQPYYFKYSFTPLFDANGQVYGVMNTAAEVTDLIITQQELEESETRYRNLSTSLEQQVQERTEELKSINEKLQATNEELAAVNGEMTATNEELAATNEELTESTDLLMRSNDNLQKFAYVASHDLQEPLRKIQSFGDLLKTRFADQLGEGVDYLDRMQMAASRMSSLIRDLLAFSRISTQRDTSQEISLADVVDAVLTDLDLKIQETGALVRVDPLPTVMGDASQLSQLFQNLLINALKFRKPEVAPVVWLNFRLISADNLPLGVRPSRASLVYYRIDVTDNGIGFDEKYLDRIFQVFQRLHGKSEFAGTGIGLAICEKVVINHGGAITATSQPGQGATFNVYLPV